MMEHFNNGNGAEFSSCRRYRYALWRIWDESKPLIMFIGLNPSKADEEKTDNTITRLTGITKKWGYGGFYMMNLFAYVSTNPDELLIPETRDVLNDTFLINISAKCATVVFVWGAFKVAKQRASEVIAMFPNAYVLKFTKDVSPWHPLYIKNGVMPIPYLKKT